MKHFLFSFPSRRQMAAKAHQDNSPDASQSSNGSTWVPKGAQVTEKGLSGRQPELAVYCSGGLRSHFGLLRCVRHSFLYSLLALVLFSTRMHTYYHPSTRNAPNADSSTDGCHKESGGRRCPAAGVFDKCGPFGKCLGPKIAHI